MPAIRDGVKSISRYIGAKQGKKINWPNGQGKAAGSMRRIYGESLFKDVYGCDCTSVHQKTDKVIRTYGASGITSKLCFEFTNK